MKIEYNNQYYNLVKVPINFTGYDITNIFSRKNNKTLAQTLEHRRYAGLRDTINSAYSDFLQWQLGEFVLHLKSNNDSMYKKFLNAYGDGLFCKFKVPTDSITKSKGLYFYFVSGELTYIGRCRDSFLKRFNSGYGTIHPKNCYKDGQATNCHLNTLINETQRNSVELYVYPITNNQEIEQLERCMIKSLSPSWNILL